MEYPSLQHLILTTYKRKEIDTIEYKKKVFVTVCPALPVWDSDHPDVLNGGPSRQLFPPRHFPAKAQRSGDGCLDFIRLVGGEDWAEGNFPLSCGVRRS